MVDIQSFGLWDHLYLVLLCQTRKCRIGQIESFVKMGSHIRDGTVWHHSCTHQLLGPCIWYHLCWSETRKHNIFIYRHLTISSYIYINERHSELISHLGSLVEFCSAMCTQCQIITYKIANTKICYFQIEFCFIQQAFVEIIHAMNELHNKKNENKI